MIKPINHDVINKVTETSRLKMMLDTSMYNSVVRAEVRKKLVFTIMQNNGDDLIQMVWNRNTEYIQTRLSTLNPQLKDQQNS